MDPVIIACGARKVETTEPVPAHRLYTGSLFKRSLRTAITLSDQVLILSAGYGIVRAQDLLLPYNYKMTPRLAEWMKGHIWFPDNGRHLLPTTYAQALHSGIRGLLPKVKGMGYMMQALKALEQPTVLCDLDWEGILLPMLPPEALTLAAQPK